MKNSFVAFVALAACGAFASPLFGPSPQDFQTLGKRAPAQVITKCSQPNTVALTFDDGPYIWHELVSQTLKNNGVKGTFFVNGNNYDCIYTESVANMLKQSLADGNQIASHTWSHPHLNTLSADQVQTELTRLDTATEKILGVKSAFVRPPYGEFNDIVRNVTGNNGQNLVTWDFDSGDSVGVSLAESQARYDTLFRQTRPSNVLALNHETVNTTVHQLLPYVLNNYKNSGYQFVTVAECLGMDPYISQVAPGTRDESWNCN